MASGKLSIIARSFSTNKVANQLIKPPIQIFGLEGRYATALYSAASKEKTLDNVEKDLVKLQSTLKTDLKFREFILNPTIKRNVKTEALKSIATKISLNSQTSNLLQILSENGRLKNLDAVINAFKLMMSSHRGEVVCEVTTAKELDSTHKKKLEGVLKSFVKSNQSIHLTSKVDPSIIGGMIVSIGDKYVDMSIASKIKKYRDAIAASV